MRRPRDGREGAIQGEQDDDSILFSRVSLYSVIGMLTLAVLFCAGVLAYTMRRNDLLKTEYYRLMSAIVNKTNHGRGLEDVAETTEATESMGPAAGLPEVTLEGILVLLTHRTISVIDKRNKTSATKDPIARLQKSLTEADSLYYDDLDSGPKGTSPADSTSSTVATTKTWTTGSITPVREVITTNVKKEITVMWKVLTTKGLKRRRQRADKEPYTSKFGFLDAKETFKTTVTKNYTNLRNKLDRAKTAPEVKSSKAP